MEDSTGYLPWYKHVYYALTTIDVILMYLRIVKGFYWITVSLKYTIMASVLSAKISLAAGQFLLAVTNIVTVIGLAGSIPRLYLDYLRPLYYHIVRVNPWHRCRLSSKTDLFLRSYPNLEIVSRDGSQTYVAAIRQAHPKVIQIIDRFHLLKSLTDYCKSIITKTLS